MAYSDHLIKPALIELSERGAVTMSAVSEKTGIPVPTIKSSVQRMLEHKIIIRTGSGRKWGYKYSEPDS